MDNTRVSPVDALLASIRGGSGVPSGIYASDAVLDATVPSWRLEEHGPAAIAAQLSSWYADPAELEQLQRTPIPGGELVRVTVTWTEGGTPFAANQAHLICVAHGQITRQEVWCGGRWPASLQAEIEAGIQRSREAAGV